MADLVKSSQAGDEAGPEKRVGTVIKGKWKVESLLGVGGMAAVFAATHRNGQRAALKILHTDFAREKAICERFLREAYVSNKVNSGATVQVLDDDMTDQGEPFLVMELLEGETVRDAWKRAGRTMPIGRVLQICERVLDCLASCHAIKVIHRDLKPANIFITNEDEIRVLDFGVAQMRDATSERTATGTALGTPAYMSPEQAMGLVDQLDGRADLFSVGAMMHALMTGHRINNGRTEQEALVMAATKPVPSVARIAQHLPVELIKVIDKSLAWDRRNRFQDARDMQVALLELMPSQGVIPLVGRPPPRPNEVVAAPLPATAAMAVPQAAPLPSLDSAPPLGAPGPAVRADAPPAPVVPAFDPLVSFGVPTPAQPSIAPPATGPTTATTSGAPPVPENDPRVQNLRDLMKHLDRLLPSVRQFGWDHPATERALRTCHEGFVQALQQHPDLVAWTIRPYSLMTLGHTVWEPSAPYDAIPYNLFACGMRGLEIKPGITLDEMRELVGLFLTDPARDLPPEDDLAAAFWDKGFAHVRYECVDAFAEGDATEREAFYGEADELEKLAEVAARNTTSALEARAMAVSTDTSALARLREPSPFTLEPQARTTVAAQLEIPRDGWSERYVEVLVEGYLDAATSRDAPLVLMSLRRSTADLAVAGRLGVAFALNRAANARLKVRVQGEANQQKLAGALTNAMFGGESLELVLKTLKEDESLVPELREILAVLAPTELPVVVANLRDVKSDAFRAVLAAFVERYVTGREAEVAAAAPGSDPENASLLLGIVAKLRTQAAQAALAQVAQSDDPNVRFEARVLLASTPEQVLAELGPALEAPAYQVRGAALRVIVRYMLRNAYPTVVRLVQAKTFPDVAADERRDLLRAALLLGSDRAEPILVDIVKKGGVLLNEARESTRATAAEVLGELSRSRVTASALQDVSQSRWGVSDETKMASANAAKLILARASGTGGAP